MDHTAWDVVHRFYAAFTRRDWQTMQACYHPDAHFSDPVFDVRGRMAAAVWHLLCESGVDLRVVHDKVRRFDSHGVVTDWDAWYTFTATGRRVHNRIEAHFEFVDGLIMRHVDHFSFWRWSRQALGPIGLLLGWTPWMRHRVRKQAWRRLQRFVAEHPQYSKTLPAALPEGGARTPAQV